MKRSVACRGLPIMDIVAHTQTAAFVDSTSDVVTNDLEMPLMRDIVNVE